MWRLFMAVLATLALAGGARAEPAPPGRMPFRTFGASDGLQNLVVIGITQDADGSLWVGTDDGLYRYDGERFRKFSVADGLVSSAIGAVGLGPDGQVCGGSSSGLVCWNGDRFVQPGGTGLPAVAVLSMVSHGGRLWVGTAAGLYVGDMIHGFTRAAGWPGSPSSEVRAMWADAGGLVVADGGRLALRRDDGTWQALSTIGLTGDRIDGVLRDRAGALWIRAARHMWRLQAGAAAIEDVSAGLPSGYDLVGIASCLTLGAHGELWVGTDDGLASREGDRWRILARPQGFPGPSARTLFVDREGTMWIGGIGLYQWRGRSLIERHDLSTGLPGDIAWSFRRDDTGTLWVGTNRCLARAVGGVWTCLPGTEDRVVRSFVFVDGGVFVAGAPSDLLHLDAAGVASSIVVDPQLQGEQNILSLAVGPEGDLWIGTQRGLYRLAGAVPGTPARVDIPGVQDGRSFSSILVDQGRLWTPTGDGIAVLDHGTWRLFGQDAGFLSPSMRYLVKGHDQRFCAAYREALGLTCFRSDGRTVWAIENIGIAEGLTTGMVYFVVEDRRRRLWIGTGNGVDVITPDGPRRGIEHFAESDGLAGDDAAATAFLEDADGSMWLGSTGGATHVLAQHYDGPLAPPRSRFLDGRLGQRRFGAPGGDVVTTAHDHNALTLELGTDSLIDANRLEYQVRLSPLEDSWITTHNPQARYPALPPGEYRFEMRARIGAGAWGPAAVLRFEVEPAWWQTRWLLVVGIVICLGGLAATVTWRQRRVLRRRTRELERELLRQSEARFRALIESMPDLMGVVQDGELVYLNRASRRLLGLEGNGELPPGNALFDRVHPDDLAGLRAMLAHAPDVDSGAVVEHTLMRIRSRDGSWRTCEVSAMGLRYHGREAHVTSGRDVTERERMQSKLLVSDRMASLGTLAAGIAHEINNPLAYVIGNLEVMSEMLGGGRRLGEADRAELVSAIADAGDGAERVRKIVHGLRTFSRPEEDRRDPLEIPDVLAAAVRLAGNEVRHRAQLVLALGPTPRVIADDGRLTQVFINLLVNAAQAIPEGRSDANRITVRTCTDDLGRAVIEIEDTGPGMTPEVQARAFDPFFTTKAVGEGTGLGLSLCHGIISALGGQISIESAPGRGTVVRVILMPPPEPVERAAAGVIAPPAAVTAAVRHRVMIVDDDVRVAEMLERVLRRDHELTVVSCGQDALDRIAAGDRFDAIVSDVMMPNMTGVELLDELERRAPDQARRLIFLSGGAFTAQTRQRLDASGTPNLEKPVSSAELRRCVAQVISAATTTCR